MITEFTLKNFRSYQEARLPLASLTLLIGANASGKSNALEGLRMFSRMAQGLYLSDVFKTLAREGSIRGTIDDLSHAENKKFGFGCRLSNRPYNNFRLEVANTGQELVVTDEEIESKKSNFPLYKVAHPAEVYEHQLKIAYNNFARGGIKPQISADNRQAIFSQLTTPARFTTPKAQELIPKYTQEFRQILEQMLFLDPIPRLMRDYSFVKESMLQSDGANISSVLYDLCQVKGRKNRILDFVQALPEQDIRDIDFLKTPRNEVMVTLAESFGGRTQQREAALLSDGTLRVLAVAAAVLSAPQGALVVIEEIDNGIHPSRAKLLLDNIQQAAMEHNLHVLLTTHNPALMDALSTKAIPDVVYCYRDPNKGDSRLIRLKDLADYPRLIAQGTVGQLIQRGILERYLKHDHPTRKDKKQASLEWLETFKDESQILKEMAQ